MDKDIKAKWVVALRSGRYRQGRRRLYSGAGEPVHCCLGVLRHMVTGKNTGSCTACGTMLSARFIKSLGLQKAACIFLASMNDGEAVLGRLPTRAWGFQRIATYIERHL